MNYFLTFIFILTLTNSSFGREITDYQKFLKGTPYESKESLKNKIVVFEWFNKGCPFVKKFYLSNKMQELQKKWTQKENLVWITVVSSKEGKQGHENRSQSNETRKEWNIKSSFTHLDIGGKLGKHFGAITTPHMYILKNNKVLYEGAIDSIPNTEQSDIPKAKNYLDLALNEIYQDQKISIKKTKAYGCSVKY